METLIFSVVKVEYVVREPDPKDVLHLVSNINEALEESGIEIEYDGSTILVECDQSETTVQFSKLVCDTFGITDKMYRNNDKVSAATEIVLVPSPHNLLIQTELVQPQHAFDKSIQFLFLTEYPKKGTLQTKANPIIYIPVMGDRLIEFADISVEDEHGVPINMIKNSHSQVLVHLRQKLY